MDPGTQESCQGWAGLGWAARGRGEQQHWGPPQQQDQHGQVYDSIVFVRVRPTYDR